MGKSVFNYVATLGLIMGGGNPGGAGRVSRDLEREDSYDMKERADANYKDRIAMYKDRRLNPTKYRK